MAAAADRGSGYGTLESPRKTWGGCGGPDVACAANGYGACIGRLPCLILVPSVLDSYASMTTWLWVPPQAIDVLRVVSPRSRTVRQVGTPFYGESWGEICGVTSR
ncbi:hypothetical protein KRMM14A1259_19180 [Krasilnikovia sp. MM14-A1259]